MWMFIGCIHPHTPSDSKTASINPALEEPSLPAPKVEFYVHKVRWSGETLSIIAQWYTGSHKNWNTVARANPDLNPNLILIGDDILIPPDLLKTNEPMPQEYLYTLSRKKRSHPSSRVEPAIESNEIELFRPQDTEQPTVGLEEIELFEPQDTEPPTVGIEEVKLFGPQDKEKSATGSDEIELLEPQDAEQATAKLEDIELFGPQDKEMPAAGSDEIELFEPQDIEPLKTESDEIELFER